MEPSGATGTMGELVVRGAGPSAGREGAVAGHGTNKGREAPASCAEEVYGAGEEEGSRGWGAERGQLWEGFGSTPRAMGNHKGFQRQSDQVRLATYEGDSGCGWGADCRAGKAKRCQMRGEGGQARKMSI